MGHPEKKVNCLHGDKDLLPTQYQAKILPELIGLNLRALPELIGLNSRAGD